MNIQSNQKAILAAFFCNFFWGLSFLACYSLTRLSVARATVFANLTTTVSVLAGAMVLHEPLTVGGAVCCVLRLVGIYGVQR